MVRVHQLRQMPTQQQSALTELHRRLELIARFQDIVLTQAMGPRAYWQRDNEDLRIRFLNREITPHNFRVQCFKRDNMRCKAQEMREALELLPILAADTVCRLFDQAFLEQQQHAGPRWGEELERRVREALDTLDRGRSYVNDLVSDVSARYESGVYRFPPWHRGDSATMKRRFTTPQARKRRRLA